jgi:hypothetical protein
MEFIKTVTIYEKHYEIPYLQSAVVGLSDGRGCMFRTE